MSSVGMPVQRSGGPYVAEPANPTRPALAFVLLLGIAFTYYFWFSLTQRTIDAGDGISLLAAKGILEHGYPRLPSGFTYPRGPLAHYLIAGSMALFGTTAFAISLPHILFALGSMVTVWRIAVDILKRPWVGVAAAFIMLAATLQTWYATGPRMYMPLQFFTMIAVYAGWRGFVEGETKYKSVMLASLIAGTLSNQQGATVALALPLTILCVRRLRGDDWRAILSAANVATVLLLGAITLLIATYRPPTSFPLVIGHAGIDPDRIGLNLSPVDWGRHILQLERSIPYSMAFIGAAFLAWFSLLRRRLDPQHRWSYLFLAFTLAFVVFGLVVRRGGHRLTLFLIPLYTLLVCGGISSVIGLLVPRANTWLKMPRRQWIPALVIVALGGALSVSMSTLKELSFSPVRRGEQTVGDFIVTSFGRGLTFGGLFRDGYGLPCGHDWRCNRDFERVFDDIRKSLQPTDLVVSTIPFETHHLLGRIDGWLFFRRGDREYPTLEHSPVDEYFGASIIDTAIELRQIASSGKRVWIIANRPTNGNAEAAVQAMWNEIEANFDRVDENGEVIVYYRDTMKAANHLPLSGM